MTISSTTSKNQYTGNGSNTVFAYTFKIFEEGDIAVFEGDTLQTITTHYTVSGVGNDAGGNITFVTAPANGVTVTLKRAEPLLQSIDYTENDDFPAAAHEEGLDRSVIRDQTIQEELDRSVKASDGSTFTATQLQFPASPADGNVLSWSGDIATGTLTWVVPNTSAFIDPSDFLAVANNLSDVASTSTALTNLGAQEAISGASLTAVTVATDDKVVIQDTSDSNNIKTVTTQSIVDLDPTNGYRLGSVQTFTASGTWTRPANCRAVVCEAVGGGGGGGYGAVGQAGAGGGAGGWSKRWVPSPGASETVTIGAGGTGGIVSSTNGTAGGNTSFGAWATGNGGGGGFNSGNMTPGTGGGATGGQVSVQGQHGHRGDNSATPGGNGGSSQHGAGGIGALGAGGAGFRGGGGAGGHNGADGGAGGAGFVIVWEYY